MQTLYLFSGLGADKRVFQYIDFSGFDIRFIEWIVPEKEENISQYAQRLTAQIPDKNPILVGLSFGGMMAIEVAKWTNPTKVILIASAKNYQEIPFYYRILGKLTLHKILPIRLFKQANTLSYWFFGAKTEAEKQLLADIFQDTDSHFLAWAIDKILTWENTTIPANLLHIHGTKDQILPICFVKSDIQIENGGHFMTINEAERVSLEIKNALK